MVGTPGGDREGWRETNRLLVSSGLGLKKMDLSTVTEWEGDKACWRLRGGAHLGKDLLG